MACVYCDSPEIAARRIVENEFALAFPTNIPITPGHTLVIPKRHVGTYEALTDHELTSLFELAASIQSALRKTFGAEGFNCAFNVDEVAGQSIPHFHLHIVPRKAGDTGITMYEPREFLYRPGDRASSPEEELRAVAAQIREAL